MAPSVLCRFHTKCFGFSESVFYFTKKISILSILEISVQAQNIFNHVQHILTYTLFLP